MPSLLEKVKRTEVQRAYKHNEIEIAVAWLQGDVTGTQISKVIKSTRQNVYNWLSPRLRAAYQQGKITITK